MERPSPSPVTTHTERPGLARAIPEAMAGARPCRFGSGHEQGTPNFFTNIQSILSAGQPAIATALLQLGPSNLGAQAYAQLAANEPLFFSGMEKALQGIAQAEIVATAILQHMKQMIAFATAAVGKDGVTAFTAEVHKLGLPVEQEMLAVAIRFQNAKGPVGAAARGIIDTARTEFVATRIGAGASANTAAVEFADKLKALKDSVVKPAGKAVAKASAEGMKETKGQKEAGKQGAEGYAKGLTDGTQAVKSASIALAEIANQAFKNHLGISSPSKVTRYYGRMTGEGLALGILDKTARVATAATALAGSAVSAPAAPGP